MYQEGDHFHYSEEEVANIFRPDYEIGNWQVSHSEYISLCKLIACLRKDHVDILQKDIHLVVVGLERGIRMDNKKMPCAFINLRDKSFLDEKKGIVVLSPFLLTCDLADIKLKKIQHEIAHYVKNHPTMVQDPVERKRNEDEAEALAQAWLNQESHHLGGLRPENEEGAQVG